VAVIGGLLISTAVSLLVLPSLVQLTHRLAALTALRADGRSLPGP